MLLHAASVVGAKGSRLAGHECQVPFILRDTHRETETDGEREGEKERKQEQKQQ